MIDLLKGDMFVLDVVGNGVGRVDRWENRIREWDFMELLGNGRCELLK